MDPVGDDVLRQPTTAAARVSVNVPIKHSPNEGLWACFDAAACMTRMAKCSNEFRFLNLRPRFVHGGGRTGYNLHLALVSLFLPTLHRAVIFFNRITFFFYYSQDSFSTCRRL